MPAQPHPPVWLIITHAASAMVLGLCAALPVAAATHVLTWAAICLTRGCHAPTGFESLVLVVAITAWATATGLVGAYYTRTLLKTNDHPHTPASTPRGIRP